MTDEEKKTADMAERERARDLLLKWGCFRAASRLGYLDDAQQPLPGQRAEGASGGAIKHAPPQATSLPPDDLSRSPEKGDGYAAASTVPVLNAATNVGTLTVSGVSATPKIRSLSIEMTNNLYELEQVSVYEPLGYGLGKFEVRGTIMRWQKRKSIMMKKPEVVALIQKACAEHGGQNRYAMAIGVSAAYLSDVLNGRRDPGPSILEALGLREEVTYVRIAEENNS